MNPAIIAAAVVVAAVLGFVFGVLIIRARTRSVLERLAAEQQTSVQLLLRRKVAETGVDIGDLQVGTSADEVLAANVRMANALLEHDRKAIELGDTQEFGLASTLRLQSMDEDDLPKLPTKD